MDATAAFEARAAGQRNAAARFVPVVYQQLEALARRYVAGERPGSSLEPNDLVHEAYLRLIDASRISWAGKTHFFAVAAVQMRRVLVDRARAHRARKRGGSFARVTLDEEIAEAPGNTLDVLALEEAIEKLRALDERQAAVIELRFFGGLTNEEVAYVLEVSERTVKEDWRVARAWMARELRLLDESRP